MPQEAVVGHVLTLYNISTNWKKNRHPHDQLQVIQAAGGLKF